MEPDAVDGPPSVRDRILEATLRTIGSEGIDAVRHRRVAERAGVSLGSTSYHFDRREDLIEEAFAWYLDRAATFLTEIEGRHRRARSPAASLVAHLEDIIETEFEQPDLIQAEHELLLYAARHPRLAARVQSWDADRRRHLAAELEKAGAPRAADGARTLMALVRGIEVEHLLDPDRPLHLRRRLTPVVAAIVTGPPDRPGPPPARRR